MKKLFEVLNEKGYTLGSVESMTAGLFASTFVETPGASKVFKGGLVTYSVEEKIKLLGIEENLINYFGVVSKEVAGEMASKGQKVLNVDVCVSVTGNAGPTAEPGGMPVGRTYVGVQIKDKSYVYELNFSGTRNKIRKHDVLALQEKVLELLTK